jgi:hypothetical protein
MDIYAAFKARSDSPTMGVGDGAHWNPVIEFHDGKVRGYLCCGVVDALRRDHPSAFRARSRSPPLVDDLLQFWPLITLGK